MLFLQNQLPVFYDSILKIQKDEASAVEVSKALEQLVIALEARRKETFVGIMAKSLLNKLMDDGEENPNQFLKSVDSFYETAITYIKNWKSPMQELTVLQWTMLFVKFPWATIENSVSFVSSNVGELNDGRLFDDFTRMDTYCRKEKLNDWRIRNMSVQDRWMEMFGHSTRESLQFDNLFKIVAFTVCLPGSNAHTERIFSLVNNFWSSDKSKLSVPTLEAAIWLKINVQRNCQQYYEYLKQNNEILQRIYSSEKYVNKNQQT